MVNKLEDVQLYVLTPLRGKPYVEFRALFRARFYFYVTIVFFDDIFADTQAQSGAGLFSGEKGIEYTREHVRIYACAGINEFHAYSQRFCCTAGVHR